MFALTTPPAPPIEEAVFPVLSAAADRYQVVPCAVDPAQYRVILYDGGRIAFTRRALTPSEARQFADRFVSDEIFRKIALAHARKYMESY